MTDKSRTFAINTDNRKLVLRSIFDLMARLPGEWELILQPRKCKRSVRQNKRYWKMLRNLAAVAWMPQEDGGELRQYKDKVWHEYFKQEFIGCEELPNGRLMGISTTTLKVDEFGEYMTQIEAWCAEQGYQVMEAE